MTYNAEGTSLSDSVRGGLKVNLLGLRAGLILRRLVPLLFAFFTVVAVWEIVVIVTKPGVAILPSPILCGETFWHLMRNGTLEGDIYASVRRVFIAWAVGAVVGIPLGLSMGTSRRAEAFLDPYIELFRPISPLAWIPLAILWFGIGETGKIFVVFIGTFFPVVLNTVAGAKGVDQDLIKAGRVFGCTSRSRLFLKVILPAALPDIIVGLRLSFGTGWAAIIAAELVAANSGLGYLIANGMDILRADEVLVGMVVIGVLGVAFDALLRSVQRRVMWN